MFVVVSYDIVDDRKRNKIAEILKDYGKRVQYSVFECNLDKKYINKIIEELMPFIDEEVDSLKIYYLCEGCVEKILTYGKKVVIEDSDYHII
jgi:CRISPR-associated protein Cas2